MNNHETNRWPTMIGGVLLILAGLFSVNASAQDADETTEEEVKKLDKVVITGSRIARTQIEGPSPIVIISRDQIDREGFTTIEGVLKSLSQATGIVQNELCAFCFTQNANAIDLRGLGPGRLLLLVDGRRASDYPTPYNGQSNIVNISAIPLVAVDRIEVLSGGASAIYGSDAIAGVVNIILRKDLGNSIDMNVLAGGTDDGGLSQTRFQAVGGFLGDRWNITYAFEYLDRKPLYGSQRDFMDSTQDNPDPAGRVTTPNALEVDLFTGDWIDPGDCDGFSGSTDIVFSQRPIGNYCGSPTWLAEQALTNQREQMNLYTSASLQLGDRHELYGSFNVFTLDAESDINFTYYFNQDVLYASNSNSTFVSNVFGEPGGYILIQRIFTKAEIGPAENSTDKYEEDVIDYSIGLRGEFFSPLWNYDLIYSHSGYDLEHNSFLIVEQSAQDHFFSSYDDTMCDPLFCAFPVVTIDYANVYSAGTPQLWDSLTDSSADSADTSNDVITAVIRGDLIDMPAGPLSMAAVLEWGTQDYQLNIDPRLSPDTPTYFWGITATGGGGERDRLAAGLEFSIPVHSTLHLTAAARYDKYDDITIVDDAITHNLGIEYRPSDKLLLRASSSSGFRAPDMHFVFAEQSGFFTFVADEYLCQRDEPGVPITACSNGSVQIFGERHGNPLLQEEESDSYTYGFVYEPTENLSMSVDYWDIDLENRVDDDPLRRTLLIEADCRLGRRDIDSGECVLAFSRITRNPVLPGSLASEALLQVDTIPVNVGLLETQGIDATLTWRIESERSGDITLDLGYSHVLEKDQQLFPGDDIQNIRDRGIYADGWRSRLRGSVNWRFKDFSATLFGERFGSALSHDNLDHGEEGRDLRVRTLFNLTAGYEFMGGQASIGLIVNNLFNKKPPRDPTARHWPYFDTFNYANFVIGRTVYGQVQYRFDY